MSNKPNKFPPLIIKSKNRMALLNEKTEKAIAHQARYGKKTIDDLDDLPPLMTEKELAHFLGFSTKKMQKDRQAGTGCEYVKLGRGVRYTRDAVAAYLTNCAVKTINEWEL